MNRFSVFSLCLFIFQSLAFGQTELLYQRLYKKEISPPVVILLRTDSLGKVTRVVPETFREEKILLRQKLKYPVIGMSLSIIGAFYYQHKADQAYKRYQRYYFFPEKSALLRNQVEKFDDISFGFYLTFEASVFWTFYELIRLE